MQFTSSRWVNRILFTLIILTALFFVLQMVDAFLSRKYDAEEAKQQRERKQSNARRQEWVKAEPPDGSFSVLMPHRPALLTNHVQSGQLPSIQLGCTDGGRPGRMEVYIAAYTEFPTNVDLSNKQTVYDNAHAKFAEKVGEIKREQNVMLQGISGREIEVELQNGTNLMVSRTFIAGRRLYQVNAAVPLSRGPTTNTWRFLNSLQLNRESSKEPALSK